MNEDQWREIIYLIILLVLVGGGTVRHYKNKSASLAANHIFLWIAIFGLVFLGVILFEGQGGIKQRIAGALNPSNPITNTQGNIILHKSQDGHFNVNAEINGTAIRFMVDTGASRTVLSRQDALAIGIDLNNLSYTTQTSTANGKSWSAPFTIEYMRIDDTPFHNIRGSVAQGDLDTSLLGMSFLGQLQSFTIEQNRMIMVP